MAALVLDKDHLATVFDPNGVPHRVSRQDALEYMASGHYTLEPPKGMADVQVVAPAEVKPADTKAEVAAPDKADRKAQVR